MGRFIVTDKLAAGEPRLRGMFEITLPCCENRIEMDEAATSVRCPECCVELELAADARTDCRANPMEPGLLTLAA
jgi:hypothetical protein